VALTNYVINGSTHPGGTWTIQSTNTANVGRYHDLAFLQEGDLNVNQITTSRAGVLAGGGITGTAQTPGSMSCTATGVALNLAANRGAAIVERTSLAGSYTVVNEALATVTLATADATNSRWDRVDLQVFDGVLGDNGGTSQTAYIVTTGVASGSPALPAAPTNSIPISKILLPANTVTLTAGMVTDIRKSAALRGADRILMPGDALTDVGFMVGEKRIRYNATYGFLEDMWDSVNAVWRGSQILLLPQPAQTGSGALTSGSTAIIASVAITDPGYPYHVEAVGVIDYGAALAGTQCMAALQIDSATLGTNRFGFAGTEAVTGNVNFDQCTVVEGNTKASAVGALTGAHTVYLLAKNFNGIGGASAMTIYTNFYTFAIRIVPANI
jgi:hypothetical protein